MPLATNVCKYVGLHLKQQIQDYTIGGCVSCGAVVGFPAGANGHGAIRATWNDVPDTLVVICGIEIGKRSKSDVAAGIGRCLWNRKIDCCSR